MSKAIKCDRCGFCFNPEKMYSVKDGNKILDLNQTVNFSDMVVSSPASVKEHKFISRKPDVDLCPFCSYDFLIWMALGGDIERQSSNQYEVVQHGQSDNMEDRS